MGTNGATHTLMPVLQKGAKAKLAVPAVKSEE